MSEPSPWAGAAEAAVGCLRGGDLAGALDAIDRAAPGLPAPMPETGLHEVAGLCYWQHRDLPAYVALSRERLRRLELLAVHGNPDEQRRAVRALGGTNYNLAAFAWPGWDEPGIRVGNAEREAGRAAAEACLAIRTDPANAEVPFGYSPSMAQWVVGAWQLDAGDYVSARDTFARCITLDREAGADDALSRGYHNLARLLAGAEGAGAEWDAVLAELAARPDEDAGFFRQQLLTAQRVFTGAGATGGPG